MSFGAMLTDANGVPFYIADTMPLSLISRLSFSIPASSTYVQDLFSNDGAIRFVFANSTGSQGNGLSTCEALMLNTTSNRWELWCAGAARTLNVFIFGYQYQPVPVWGIQINDAQGRCILTNETKVLRDVVNLGDSTNPDLSGYVLNTTLNGQWAVAPVYTGYFSGVVYTGGGGNGQPHPIVAQYCSSARYNGSTTQISSGYIGNLEAQASNASWVNYRNRITAIDVSKY
ncbi:hypothetical protein [Pantoea piersonii]|uniref:hypothetical protein n=1 Tax=Pantoea piersonii TaxID=2364647 RepID=UPI002FDA953E